MGSEGIAGFQHVDSVKCNALIRQKHKKSEFAIAKLYQQKAAGAVATLTIWVSLAYKMAGYPPYIPNSYGSRSKRRAFAT